MAVWIGDLIIMGGKEEETDSFIDCAGWPAGNEIPTIERGVL